MFGTFRLILACAVVVFHMGIDAGGLYPGVAAVICFLMVSGYAMAGLTQKSFPRLTDAPFFYFDRALRLMPQYWFYVAVSTVTIYVLGWRYAGYQDAPMSLVGMISNILPPPFGAHYFPVEYGHIMMMPQCWSLGIEILFYLALPFLLTSRWVLAAALAYAGWIFARATHGILNPDLDGYRFMPAPLLWLGAGVALQRKDWWMYGAIGLFAAGLFVSLVMADKAWLAMNAPLFLGAAIGYAVMPVLAMLPRRTWDDWLGNASYGAFLAHYVFVAAFRDHIKDWNYVWIALAGALICGWMSYALVEYPVARWRRRIRRSKPVPAVSPLAAQ